MVLLIRYYDLHLKNLMKVSIDIQHRKSHLIKYLLMNIVTNEYSKIKLEKYDEKCDRESLQRKLPIISFIFLH